MIAVSAVFWTTDAVFGRRGCSVGDNASLVRDRRLGIRRVSRVLLDAADEIERGVVLRIRRNIGLRAGLLVAFGLEMAAQRSLALRWRASGVGGKKAGRPPQYKSKS